MDIINKQYQWNGKLANRVETKMIVLHHAMAKSCTADDVHKWHRDDNGWAGIGYHFFVRKDGTVYTGRPINTIGAHCEGFNYDSIGICFEGDFMQENMNDVQANAGIELIRHIRKLYAIKRVVRHKDLRSSNCPGINFPDKIMIEGMKDMNEVKHWTEDIFNEVNNRGIKVSEKRFDEPLKRGEAMALILQLLNKIENK